MKSHELKVKANKSGVRAGRGIAAGRGKTAGRGTKGQNSRSGGKVRPGFEGGQNPMFRRLPKKRGFRSYHPDIRAITTGEIDQLGAKVNNQILFDAGLIAELYEDVKVVVKGEIKSKHTVDLFAASKGAIESIEKVGGTFNKIDRQMRPKVEKSDKK